MKRILTSLAGVLVAGLFFGFWSQAYALPRIGLRALPFGQYLVFYSIVIAGALVIGVLRGLSGVSERRTR